MITLVLDDLRGPALEFSPLFFEIDILVFHFNLLISRAYSHADHGQAAHYCM